MNNEELSKTLSKLLIENDTRNLTNEQKEIIKQAVDQARNMNELMKILALAKLHG